MKIIKISTLVTLILFSLASTSCLKNKISQDIDVDPPFKSVFEFETTKLCEVNLDFDLNNYSIIAELYSVNPLDENGDRIKDIQPILRTITNKKGAVNDVVSLEKSVKTVYFYTEYLGLQNLIPIAVTENKINFSVKSQSKSATRSALATTTRGTVPVGIMTIGEWDNAGIPNYLAPRVNLPENLFYDILSCIPKYANGTVSGALKYLNEDYQTELDVSENTEINLMLINETASMKNSICYYHYPTGQKPESIDDVKLIIAFPNLSFPDYINGTATKGLSSGDNVQLKYWNSDKRVFENEFPAGTTLALAIMTNSFKTTNGAVSKNTIYYANANLNISENEKNREHIIIMHEKNSDTFIHMFEDRPRNGNVIDGMYPGGDFHDAIIYISPKKKGAISSSNVPELPKSETAGPEKSSTTYEGTLMFEDLWPEEGDYDMNDIVLEYISTVYRNKNNRVTGTEDEYTIKNIGGQRACGFGYQLGVNESSISSVTVTPTDSDIATNAKGLEVGQIYNTPSIMLFGNIQNQTVGKKFKVITKYSSHINSNDAIPPYNPFIVITERGKELHLTNHKPTSLANLSYLGNNYDASNIEKGIYYVSKSLDYPFALKLPIRGFKISTEGVRIDKTYSEFSDWVKSKGETNNDWYN